jgi:hypothetical protein
MVNSPDEYITRVPIGVVIPQFFLAAGSSDLGDVHAAETFKQELELRVGNVPLVLIAGGHQAKVWRGALTPMFDWMTPQLTAAVAQAERLAKEHALPRHRHPRPHLNTRRSVAT